MIKAQEFSFKDIPIKVDWINNPKINNTMYFDLPATVEKTVEWYKNKNNKARTDFSFFDENDAIIGMAGYTCIDKKNSNAEFYVMISPSLHGKGYGRKISLWMFNYAFLKLELNKIYLYTNDENIAAYIIYEDAGFKLEGILREHKYKNGSFLNRRLYGLLRKEWQIKDWRNYTVEYEF